MASYLESARDYVLDASILYAFDRSGFERHSRCFRGEDLEAPMDGRVCLVTGATSGLGLATARALAGLGTRVWVLGREAGKTEETVRTIRRAVGQPDVRSGIVDVSLRRAVREFAAGFPEDRVDVLVHNAGVLPDDRVETEEGLELTLATHVVGPFLLTRLLLPKLERSRDARVILVSSGGMYAQRLRLDDVQWRNRRFDGTVAYADTKRMQVVLNELWAEHCRESGISFSCMHPGWADTPGVQRSLPRFYRWMKGRLRTAEQGADTIVWLAVARRAAFHSGTFWFDRRPAPTHLLPWTRETDEDREQLWRLCLELAQQTA